MNAPQQYTMARQSGGVAPLRRAGSIRRTTSIDSTWPDGAAAAWLMEARARDVIAPIRSGTAVVIAEAGYMMRISPRREILELSAWPEDARIAQLIGVRAGGESRSKISSILGELAGAPLYQILDDFAGSSLVARWIWSQWKDDWQAFRKETEIDKSHGRNGEMLDVCTGFAKGSTALNEIDMSGRNFSDAPHVGGLPNPDDPNSWHKMAEQQGPAMRRARRIDAWRDGNLIIVDAFFQDSGTSPAGGRRGVHEYRVHAEIDGATYTMLSLQALPMILPFAECPGASVKAGRVVGRNVAEFRNVVLDVLPGTLGCTHLNDVLRSLADVPAMVSELDKGIEAHVG
ncbi:hypothetical protein J2W40_003322 [Sphingobium xenophagum]|uniref:DUF2889 domain-containing protein n=1 Tax=Sphingobium xenophagum TaxID=121428 RepID=A0ABU1X4J3_SPHXE|nr:DUF2889 domain-containing protein [Sphingobium xenophagum]MDR7156478.1 hypothetical protein [Sphingobium xenophagum]